MRFGIAIISFTLALGLASPVGADSLRIDTFQVIAADGVPMTVVRYLCPEVPVGTPMVRIEGTGATTWLAQNPMKEICRKEGAAYLVHPRGQGAGSHLNMAAQDLSLAPDRIAPTRGRAKYGMWNMPEDFDAVVRFAFEDLERLGIPDARIDVSGHSLGAWIVTNWAGGMRLGQNGVPFASPELSRDRLSRVRSVIPMGVWDPAEFGLRYRLLAAVAAPLQDYFRTHDLQLPYDVEADPIQYEAIRHQTEEALAQLGLFSKLPYLTQSMKDEIVGILARIFVRNGIIDMAEYPAEEVLEIARKGSSGKIRGPLIAEYIQMIRDPSEMSAIIRQAMANIGDQDVTLLFVGSEGDGLTPASHARALARIARNRGKARVEVLTMEDQSHVGMVYTEKSWREILLRMARLEEEVICFDSCLPNAPGKSRICPLLLDLSLRKR